MCYLSKVGQVIQVVNQTSDLLCDFFKIDLANHLVRNQVSNGSNGVLALDINESVIIQNDIQSSQ